MFAEDLQNNKFGIHLATPDDGDLDRAEELVNSSGGRWGYVTLVIQENDRDLNKWQGVFDKLREQRMIPIIRIATKPDGSNWRRPDKSDAQSWVDFLNKLHWSLLPIVQAQIMIVRLQNLNAKLMPWLQRMRIIKKNYTIN